MHNGWKVTVPGVDRLGIACEKITSTERGYKMNIHIQKSGSPQEEGCNMSDEPRSTYQ